MYEIEDVLKGVHYFSWEVDKLATYLSRLPRFVGHMNRQFTVGQHLLHCDHIAGLLNYTPRERQLVLYHDVPEAFYGDIPTYVKKFLGAQANFRLWQLDQRIYEKLGIEFPRHKEQEKVKYVDLQALSLEAHYGFNDFNQQDWPPIEVDAYDYTTKIAALPQEAVAQSLSMLLSYYKEQSNVYGS